MLTFEQFEEIVAEAIDRHVSLEESLCAQDQRWEVSNFAKTLARQLRENGVNAPHPEAGRTALQEDGSC